MALGKSRRLLDRGREHTADLVKQFIAFRDGGDICARVVEADPNGTDELHKIKLVRPLPESFANIAADAANNIRAALDHAGYAVALATGAVNPKRTNFPFAGSAASLDNAIKGRCGNLPQEVIALFRSFRPYRGGNDILWALNEVCTTNKHKLLCTVGVAVGGMFVRRMEIRSAGGGFTLPMPRWDCSKQEIILARIGPGGHIEYDLRLAFFIAFDEGVEVVGGQPVDTVLNLMASEVESILMATEVEALRLGLIS